MGMGMGKGGYLLLLPLLALALASWWPPVANAAELPPGNKPLIRQYYKKLNTCANAEAFVHHQVQSFWQKDKSLPAQLLKLVYADCMVNGCDASVLLAGPGTERTAPQNAGLKGFEVIDKIKIVLEDRCPGVVSCADILHLAARDAVHLAGAPSYPVYLGRRDGLDSKAGWVNLPSPSISWDSALAFFQSKGLNVLDMTTLLGAHSLGRAHCRYIWDRLYNFNNTGKPDPSMKKSFLITMREQCPRQLKNGQSDPLIYLDPDSGPNFQFNNTYYSRVLSGESVLGVDQQLRYGRDTKEITQEFAGNQEMFRREFALAMSRMGRIQVLTGTSGEIRRVCSRRN
ncbi:probable peroxidase 26 [Diospyros lotus]|uniref:probable peroxidase 26 n=1 Tax=Diospyros lotus TaxID=55363 RepID=UPI0022514DAE|nr:probable peroxidase 26 [Diospyros lotus]